MTTIDQTRERAKHASEVLAWWADGKPLQWNNCQGPEEWSDSVSIPEQIAQNILCGWKYRIKPAKTRRPFTEQEARVLVGCVLVSPDGVFSQCPIIYNDSAFYSHGLNPTFNEMANDKWHYHLPGHPDDLKPCWVEE